MSKMISRSMASGSFVHITPFTNPFTLNRWLFSDKRRHLSGSHRLRDASDLSCNLANSIPSRPPHALQPKDFLISTRANPPYLALHCRLIAHYSSVLSSNCFWKNETRHAPWTASKLNHRGFKAIHGGLTIKLALPASHLAEELSGSESGIPWLRQPNTVRFSPFAEDCGRRHTHTQRHG